MTVRGQVILQSWILAEYYLSQQKSKRKYEESKKGPKDAALLGSSLVWNTAMAGAGSVAVWTPWFRAAVVGTIGTKVAAFAAPPVLGYTAGALVGTVIAEAAFDEGEMAYDLYTNPRFEEGGITYETANILGNAYTIIKHYESQTLPGGRGNPAHPQYEEPGLLSRYREMYGV